MKAGLLVGLNEFDVRGIDKPLPGPHEVLIKVKAAGICGSVFAADGDGARDCWHSGGNWLRG